MSSLVYASRGSYGLTMRRGVVNPDEVTSLKLTVVIETATGAELFAFDKGKTQHIDFSPRDTVLVTYEPYLVYGASRLHDDGTLKVPGPNLNLWSLSAKRSANERHLKEFVVKKQSAWRLQFSEDETLAVRLSDKGLFVYDEMNFNEGRNIAVKDLEAIAVSPGASPFIMCFIPSVKGQPALLQLRQLAGDLPTLFSKLSFNCDKCTMTWNSKGNAVLVTASVDVDKSDKSYYGVSHLHCITTKCDSFQVHLDKAGPLHYVEWSPNGNQFCVCYGFMPSKVAIYNMKGEVLWDIGEGHRNEVHYSPFGDILVTCGFGNISSGKMTFWNIESKSAIVEHEAPMTTQFEWAPDGRHFFTATTAPRLRTSNGLRIWHYANGIIYEHPEGKEELWQVLWRPSRAFTRPEIAVLTEQQRVGMTTNSNRAAERTPLDNLPTGAITKHGRYVPPHMRNNKGTAAKAGGSGGASTSALSETEKKIKNIQKKLQDIAKLKEKQNSGNVLELNQVEKIRHEEALRAELNSLKLAVD